MLKVLHTSDWHLGRLLDGEERGEEFYSFFSFMLSEIERRGIDVLLVSGDVFDSSVPRNSAVQAFADLLTRLRSSSLSHAVFIAGNHDSASFLRILKTLGENDKIHIFPNAPSDGEGLVLDNRLYIMPIAFLRDGDLGLGYGEDYETRQLEAYARYFNLCDEKYSVNGMKIPCICMAHLFLTGSSIAPGDGVRANVGTLGQVSASLLPKTPCYYALGHIHKPQRIGKRADMRYCGTPLAMSFDEAADQKTMIEVCIKDDGQISIEEVPIPRFRNLQLIKGDLEKIRASLEALGHDGSQAYCEIVYEGPAMETELYEKVRLLCPPNVHLVAVKASIKASEAGLESIQDLGMLSPATVFQRKLDDLGLEEEQRRSLTEAFSQALKALEDEDENT